MARILTLNWRTSYCILCSHESQANSLHHFIYERQTLFTSPPCSRSSPDSSTCPQSFSFFFSFFFLHRWKCHGQKTPQSSHFFTWQLRSRTSHPIHSSPLLPMLVDWVEGPPSPSSYPYYQYHVPKGTERCSGASGKITPGQTRPHQPPTFLPSLQPLSQVDE